MATTIVICIFPEQEIVQPEIKCEKTETNENITLEQPTNEIIDDTIKKRKYKRCKYACPVPNCKRNNTPVLLNRHLRRVHKLQDPEVKHWLLEARLNVVL